MRAGKRTNILTEEREYFDENLPEWLESHSNRVAVIKGRELLGFFDNEEQALSAAAMKYSPEPFLIRRIVAEQPEVSIPALTLGILNANTAYANSRPAS